MASVLLHELGHCAMGLGHVNWSGGAQGGTSYTSTRDVQSWVDGPDGFRGTRDDRPQPLPGSRLIHWFRAADNNPVIVDGTVIDESTYSRAIVDLPSGDAWPASGNIATSTLLGEVGTQAIMYSAIDREQGYAGLTADDVATVQFGMTGLDEEAGTADDYTVALSVVADCADADIEVSFELFSDPLMQPLAVCTSELTFIGGDGLFDIHHVLVPFDVAPRITVQVNSGKLWDAVFVDSFETGTTAAWQ